jgi:N5-(carboxyethyl)ornithine synthase
MKTVGFPISKKENEKRRALIPEDIAFIIHPDALHIESGYGEVLGFQDSEYATMGAKIVDRNEVLTKDIICDPKIGDADYIHELNNQIVFGWVHAVQNRMITDTIIANKLTAYAWEDMFEKGRHVFYRNNEIAGEAAIWHAFLIHGVFPYETNVAVIGRGNIARGAINVLNKMGAKVTVYNRYMESLLRDEITNYDVIVNAVMWDLNRKDHIISFNDLSKITKNALLIDISCDNNGAIESSRATSIESPTYVVQGVTHYVVDHTPALFYKTVSKSLSKITVKYINYLISNIENEVLAKSRIIKNGRVIDEKILSFQKRQH